MKIEVIKDKIKIDEQDIEIEDLKAELLERIVEESLHGNAEYLLAGDTPLKMFFEKIQKETSEEGEFAKRVKTLEEEIKNSENNMLDLNESNEETVASQTVEQAVEQNDDLPF